MKLDDNVIYSYDGTFEGLLTCIFTAFSRKEAPALIAKHDFVQLSIGAGVRRIVTSPEQADRVYSGIMRQLGPETLEAVYHCTLSIEDDAEAVALRYLRLGFRAGRDAFENLADPLVMRMHRISRGVSQEASRFFEFLRFSELEGGILFSEFEPEPHVLPLVMPHFADRFGALPFIIHDKGRRIAGVYDTRSWRLMSSEDMNLPDFSENEQEYRELWRLFFTTIAIKERANPRCQMQHLPKKYWRYITEMT